MTTYPSGTVSKWGQVQALTNQYSWIAYTGVDGSIFYLSGPLAPMAGAQNGVVLQKHMGLMSGFDMLELRGARQDGATWTDAVYEVGDIMMKLEASGTSPQDIRNVIRQWISAWDPRQTGILSVFTPDMGEWWANVRLGKNITDMFEKDYTFSGRQSFTWNIKNYDAFWYGPDSVSVFNSNTTQYIVTSGNPVGQFTLALQSQVSAAITALSPASAVQSAIQALSNVGSGNVVVTEAARSLWGVTYAVEFIGGLAGQLISPLVAGVTGLIDGIVGIETVAVPQGGFVPLTNIGDQPAWPRYLCYGPGTFSFGNGPGSSSMITFGPLVEGQVVMITTLPRLRSVVDLTPGQIQGAPLNVFQEILQGLISFATNNNVPPLLQQFESFFGILPPQGNLYSLLNGRFTNPIPGSPYGTAPETQFIPVAISGGDANSKIVAAITPMRRWPL